MRVTRVTVPIYQVIIFINSLLVSSEDTCPIPFVKDTSGVCLHYRNTNSAYCHAHKYCYELGVQVGGRGFIAGKYYKNRNSTEFYNTWTGLHRLSSDVGVNINSWSVTDPYSIGEYVEEKDMMPIVDKLPEAEKGILEMGSAGLETEQLVNDNGYLRNRVLCQVSGIGEAGIDPPSVEKFKRDPSDETHFSSDRIYGCQEYGTAITGMACAMRCKLNRACRSFAYHPETKQCVLQKYIPSKLNSDVEPKDGKWERFVRPDW